MYGARLARIFKDADRSGKIKFCSVADISQPVLDKLTIEHGINGYTDYKEMIEKEGLNAIAVVTPDYLHREVAIHAAGKGLHMLVQKPLDTATEGAKSIVNAAQGNNVLLYVDFHKRFDPSIILARKRLAEGAYGELLYGYINIEDTIYIPSGAFSRWAHLSSPAWFIGIHMVDALNWVLGEAPTKVSAIGHKKKLAGMGIDTFDALNARLVYESGAVINLDASWVLPKMFPSPVNQNIRLVGTEGFIEIDGQDRGVQYWSEKTNGPMNANVNNPYGYLESYNRFTDCGLSGYTVDSVLYFIKMLQKLDSGASLESLEGAYPNGEEAVIATRVVEAIHQSAGSGNDVFV